MVSVGWPITRPNRLTDPCQADPYTLLAATCATDLSSLPDPGLGEGVERGSQGLVDVGVPACQSGCVVAQDIGVSARR